MGNEVYRSVDGGRTWKKTHGDDIDVAGSKAPYSFNQIKTNPADPAQIIVNSDSMYESRDGGKTWNCQFFRGVFGDFRTMWWDEQDPQRIMLGSDGGVNVSYDGGRTADYFLNKRVGEVYAVGVDMDDPYNVYAGLQDHDSWKGPSNSRSGKITLEDWTTVGTGDGMYNQVDPTNSRWVYNSFQTGGQRRFDQLTGQAANIQPQRPQGAPALRYNWITPHRAVAAQSADCLHGRAGAVPVAQSWRRVAGDQPRSDDGRSDECGLNSGYVPYCTITSISESPLTAGVIWIGTDDGKVQLTRDHGATWTDLTSRSRRRADRPIATSVACSRRRTKRAPRSWQRTASATTTSGRSFTGPPTSARRGRRSPRNLVASPINVVVQDRKNANLLIVGNDLGVWVSIEAGAAWERLKANLPTVPVHDLTIHPRENDLVLGTYGRGIFIGDITHLQELSAEVLAKPFHVFAVEPRTRVRLPGAGELPSVRQQVHRGAERARRARDQLLPPRDAGRRARRSRSRTSRGCRSRSSKGRRGRDQPRAVEHARRAGAPRAAGAAEAGGWRTPAAGWANTGSPLAVGGQQQTTIGRIRERLSQR